MLSSRIKAADHHPVEVLALSVDILLLVKGHGDMRNGRMAKEDQVAFLHLRTLDSMSQRIVLLIGIARERVAAHAITELHKTAAIDTFPACPTPQVRHTDKGASIGGDKADRGTRVWQVAAPDSNSATRNPGTLRARQSDLEAFGRRGIKQRQHAREISCSYDFLTGAISI